MLKGRTAPPKDKGSGLQKTPPVSPGDEHGRFHRRGPQRPGLHPYTQIAGKTDEAYYHTVFYFMLSALGAAVPSEVLSSRGRMDMVVEFDDKVFIIELKCDQSSDKAIRQILEKRNYERFLGAGRTIYLVGINFDTGNRAIEDWQCKDLAEVTPDPRP